ncbi:MAG: hypothetical protein KC561_08950 [Myxococcales bacterium]|nr:hypothetical protein [Myxococcales bacterium]
MGFDTKWWLVDYRALKSDVGGTTKPTLDEWYSRVRQGSHSRAITCPARNDIGLYYGMGGVLFVSETRLGGLAPLADAWAQLGLVPPKTYVHEVSRAVVWIRKKKAIASLRKTLGFRAGGDIGGILSPTLTTQLPVAARAVLWEIGENPAAAGELDRLLDERQWRAMLDALAELPVEKGDVFVTHSI